MYIYLDNGTDSKLPAMTYPEANTNINGKNYMKIFQIVYDINSSALCYISDNYCKKCYPYLEIV